MSRSRSRSPNPSPNPNPDPRPWRPPTPHQVAAGEAHSLACTRQGDRTWGWGAGHYGQLGVGRLEPRLSPTPIEELEGKNVRSVACGANHSGAVTGTGQAGGAGAP